MRSNMKLRLAAGALLVVLFGIGCNPLTGAFFRLFRGRGALTLSVTDVSKAADEGPVLQRRMTVEYPKARGPIPVDDDMTEQGFREKFLQRIARDVSWQLTAHVTTADVMPD